LDGGAKVWSTAGVLGEKIEHCLDGAAGVFYCFSEIKAKPDSRFSWAARRRSQFAKRNGGQGIENKQFREMAHFVHPMISKTYDQGAKPIVSLCEMKPFAFAGFSGSPKPKTKWREIDRGLEQRPPGSCGGSCARP
jgi:hypothetical protein